ncbi:MAG: peptidase [Candidatus Hodarchaeota archaeon]
MMKRLFLRIFAAPRIPPEILDVFGPELSQTFPKLEITSVDRLVMPTTEKIWDRRRRQAFAPSLLAYLHQYLAWGEMGLWIVDRDLFAPQMNWIFGQAKRGIGAVLSIVRLENDLDFIVKEAIHELGHVFGLNHCQLPCVMTFSNSVAEAHQKSSRLCCYCQDILKKSSLGIIEPSSQ